MSNNETKMPGIYSKKVSTIVSSFEESRVSLSSIASPVRRLADYRQLELSPLALKFRNDFPHWTSQKEIAFKTSTPSLLNKSNQDTGIIWKQTRVNVDYNNVDKPSSSTTPIFNRRVTSDLSLVRSGSFRDTYKSKSPTIQIASTVRRTDDRKRTTNLSNTKLTTEKVLLTDIESVAKTSETAKNRIKKITSVVNAKRQTKPVKSNKTKSLTKKINLNTAVKLSNNNLSPSRFEQLRIRDKGKQTKTSKTHNAARNKQKQTSKSYATSQVVKVDVSNNISESNSSNIVSAAGLRARSQKKHAQLKNKVKVKAAERGSERKDYVNKVNNKNIQLKQIKKIPLKTKYSTSKKSVNVTSTLSLGKTKQQNKIEDNDKNSKDAFLESLQLQRQTLVKDKASTTDVSPLKKIRLGTHSVTYNTQTNYVQQMGKPRLTKTAVNKKIKNYTTQRSNIKKSSKYQPLKQQTVKPTNFRNTKSAKYLDDSVDGVSKISVNTGKDNANKIKKPKIMTKYTHRNVQLLKSPSLSNPNKNYSASLKLLSPSKSSRSKHSQNVQISNIPTSTLKKTEDDTVNKNLSNVKKLVKVRKDIRLAKKHKKNKVLTLAKSKVGKLKNRSNNNVASNLSPLFMKDIRKKGAVKLRTELSLLLDMPVSKAKRPFTNADKLVTKKRLRTSSSQSLNKELKSLPIKNQKSPFQKTVKNLTKSKKMNKTQLPVEANLQKDLTKSKILVKSSSLLPAVKVTTKHLKKTLTPQLKKKLTTLSIKKKTKKRQPKKTYIKKVDSNKQKSSGFTLSPAKIDTTAQRSFTITSPSAKKVISLSYRHVQRRSETLLQKTLSKSDKVTKKTLSSPARKGNNFKRNKGQSKSVKKREPRFSLTSKVRKSLPLGPRYSPGLSYKTTTTEFDQEESTDSLPSAHSNKNISFFHDPHSILSKSKSKNSKTRNIAENKFLYKSNSLKSSMHSKTRKQTTIPTKISKEHRKPCKRKQEQATEAPLSKKPRISDSSVLKIEIKPFVAAKQKSLNIVNKGIKQSKSKRKINKKIQLTAKKSIKITNKPIKPEIPTSKDNLNLLAIKETQKPVTAKTLPNIKKAEHRKLQRGSIKIERTKSSLHKKASRSARRSKMKISTSEQKIKLSTIRKKKKYLVPDKKASKKSVALNVGKKFSPITKTNTGPISSIGERDLSLNEKPVMISTLKTSSTPIKIVKNKKPHLQVGNRTQKQFTLRKRLINPTTAAVSQKILNSKFQLKTSLPAHTVKLKQSVSKLQRTSENNASSIRRQNRRRTEPVQLMKDTKSKGLLHQRKYPNSSQSKRKSLPLESSLQVKTSSGVLVEETATLFIKKGVNKLSPTTLQKNILKIPKKFTSRKNNNSAKLEKTLSTGVNENTRQSLNKVQAQIEHKKNAGQLKTIHSNKSKFLSQKGNFKQSNKNNDFVSSKKNAVTQHAHRDKEHIPKVSNKLQNKQYHHSVPLLRAQKNVKRNKNINHVSKIKIETAVLANDNLFSQRNNSNKAQLNKSQTSRKINKKRSTNKINLFNPVVNNSLKPDTNKRSLQSASSSVSIIKNTRKLLPPNKNVKLSIKLEAKKSQPLKSTKTRSVKVSDFKLSMNSLNPKIPRLNGKKLQAKKERKESVGKVITLQSKDHLLTNQTRSQTTSPLDVHERYKTSSRNSVPNNNDALFILDKTPVRSEQISGELGRRSLFSSHVTDTTKHFKRGAKTKSLVSGSSTPPSVKIFDIDRNSTHTPNRLPSAISRIESHFSHFSSARKDRTDSSTEEKTNTSLISWSTDPNNPTQHSFVVPVKTATSPTNSGDENLKYGINVPITIETKSRSSSTLINYSEGLSPEMEEIWSRPSPFRSIVTDLRRSAELSKGNEIMTTVSDHERFECKYEKLKNEAEHEEESNENEARDDLVEDEQNVENIKSDDDTDQTLSTPHNRQCTIS